MNSWFRLGRDIRGSASIELVILLPVLLLLGFASIETARIVQAQQALFAASRDAARQAARLEVACEGNTGNTVDGGAVLPLSTDMEARHELQLNEVELEIAYICQAGVNNQLSGLYAGLGKVVVVRVTVSGTYVPLSGLFALPAGGLRLNAVHEQVWTG